MSDSIETTELLNPTQLTIEGHNGVPINVWDYGGDGPDLVLCPCTGTLSRLWDPIVKLLNGDFRIVAPDMRGHGDSGKPEDLDSYEWSLSSEDLYAVTEQLELGPTIYAAGHSAGATQVVYCQLHHPGTFTRAVLIDPIIGPAQPKEGPNFLGDGARRRRREFPSKADAIANFSSKPPMNSWVPECVEAYVNFGLDDSQGDTATLKCPPEVEGRNYDRGGAPELFERLSEVSFEKFSHVTSDKSNVREMVLLQRPKLPDAEIIDIEGASHFIPQERPEEIAEIIRSTFA